MTIFGTDTSGSVKNAAALMQAGGVFSYPRIVSEASEGSVDPGARAMITADRKAGRTSGGYDFLGRSTADANGVSHSVAARHEGLFESVAAPFIAADPAFCAVIDLEGSQFRPKARWADVEIWAAAFRKLHGQHPIGIYVGASHSVPDEPKDWEASIGPCFHILPSYPSRKLDPQTHKTKDTMPHGLTFAQAYAFVGGNTAPQWDQVRGRKNVSVWQFQGTYTIAGQSADLNAFRGTIEQFRALVGGTGQAAVPAPTPIVTVTPFAAPRHFRIAANTRVDAFNLDAPGAPFRSFGPQADVSGASADAEVNVAWSDGAKRAPFGGPFLRVVTGVLAGLLIAEKQPGVTLLPPDPNPGP